MNTRRAERHTAEELLGERQTIVLGLLAVTFVGGIVFERHYTALTCIAAALLFYVCFVGLKAALWVASSLHRAAPLVLPMHLPSLPLYTIFVPLYHEANMLPGLVESLRKLNYPPRKLQILLLLEEDDFETRDAAAQLNLPPHYRVVLTPNIQPRGKPKALNMGLAEARGDYCVIYDAEDRPDPDQLLKAVAAFHAAPFSVACLQARLSFWNESSSWITRFYRPEYEIHFSWVLPGLAKFGLIPPLGGTSNHFRTQVLRRIAIPEYQLPVGAVGIGGWDPWNATEDAELAGALALHGYEVRIIDSVTYEEATASWRVADKQRRRWLKGYLQTGLVYTRHPVQMCRQMGFRRWFCFTLLMLGTPLSLLLNPLFWGVTVIYFATHASVIERLFPLPLYYTGIMLMVAGNLMLFYQLVTACLRQEGYSSVKYMLLTPIWWAFTSYSCVRMIIEVANPKTRHVWHKTPHGHTLAIHQPALGAGRLTIVPEAIPA